MSDSVITVESLSKRYRIRHQQQGGMRYKALRDVLADNTKSIAKRLWSAFRRPNFSVSGSQHFSISPVEDFWALKDVSFEVKQGETLGIIGRNGAGKSTLLKILSRITEPTEGRVRIQGRVASLLEVGTGFHPELTGRENIFLNGAILGMTRVEIRRKFDEIVAFAEVEKFLDTPVKRYSSGMYVRLAFAVAAHLEPEILIVDEVLAVGDAEFQKKCLSKMEKASREQGNTVLFVSHNLGAISQLTTRCILLNEGTVLSDAATPIALKAYRELGQDATSPGFYQDTQAKQRDRVVSVRVTTSEPGAIHISGCELRLDFELEVVTATDSLVFGFQIFDETHVPIIFIWYQDPSFVLADHLLGSLKPGAFRVVCRIPNFRAYLGSYTVTSLLYCLQERRFVDVVQNICEFQVVMPAGILKTFPWEPGACKYLVDAHWTQPDFVKCQPVMIS